MCVVHVCFFSGDGVCFVSGWNSLFITMEHEQLIQISCHDAVVFIVFVITFVSSSSGGPLDVLKRGVLCASSTALALKLSERIKPIDYLPDGH